MGEERLRRIVSVFIGLCAAIFAREAPAAPPTCDETKAKLAELDAAINVIVTQEAWAKTTADYQAAYSAAPQPCDLSKVRSPDEEGWQAIIPVARAELAIFRQTLARTTDDKSISIVRDEAAKEIDAAEAAYARLHVLFPTTSLACDEYGSITKPIIASKGVWEQYVDNNLCMARADASYIARQAHVRSSESHSLCGGIDADGNFIKVCASYGVTAATLSQIWRLGHEPYGLTGGRLVSVAVPYIGLRWIPSRLVSFIAIDLTAYSAYFTTGSIDASTKPTPCTGAQNALERALPCEASPQIRPYGAIQGGMTFGRDGIGYVTLSPASLGFASFGNVGTRAFFGMVVGSLQITGKF